MGRVRGRGGAVSLWLGCNDRAAPPSCLARLGAQVAACGLDPSESVRRLLAAHGAIQRHVLAILMDADACWVSTWAAPALARAPHVESHDLAEAVRAMQRR